METAASAPRPADLIALAATSICAGAFVSASTNAVNGAVSPLYFQKVCFWR